MITWSPAALVLSGVDQAKDTRERLKGAGLPIMQLWDVTDDPIDLCVGVDHHAIGLEMGRHLIHLGYQAPAYVGIASGRDPRAEKRCAGLAEAFKEAGLSLTYVRVDVAPSFEAGHIGMQQALDRPQRPDVVCFLNDHLAFGGLTMCQARGMDVPGDIGVVGFNGLNINNVLPRQITSTVTPRNLMGKTAARMLVAAIRNVRAERRITMPAPIHHGATTRPRLTGSRPGA
jgi:LacI family gluconate utilization system Gnt-I transcriptional repressor